MSDPAREGLEALKGVDVVTDLAIAKTAISAIEAALDERMVCDVCGKPAACLGHYDDAPWAYACNDCCGHGCEDGQCFPLKGLGDYLTLLHRELSEREGKVEGRALDLEKSLCRLEAIGDLQCGTEAARAGGPACGQCLRCVARTLVPEPINPATRPAIRRGL